ncbi:MAG: 3-dehydroquinate synthase [Deltaproteobacteria bacterium]|nr:3-dehydroquinate synthase [Deltaproteobacteria bacterium]
MEIVTVNLGSRSYPVCIGRGILADLGTLLREQHATAGRVAVVTDSVVGKIYKERVVATLTAAGFAPWVIEIPAGEEHKNLAWLAFLYDKLIEGRIERRSPLIALGGGVIGDITGFAAATFQRGLPFVQVPTTLLAQVDASVGGKTAINHSAGKNLIGAFYQPRLVVIDVETLTTLPRREFLAGMAEVIKYGVILSPDLFALVEEQLSALLHLTPALLAAVVKTCCQLKALVVEEDETEGDYRAILNFGHTVGHAIERATEYKLFLHGEAVAMGMAFAMHLSQQRGLCSATTKERVCRLLKTAGLPVVIPQTLTRESLLLGIEADKKVAAGKVKFVCIEEIGRTRFEHLTAQEVMGYLRGGIRHAGGGH